MNEESVGPSVLGTVLSASYLLGPGYFQDPHMIQVVPSSDTLSQVPSQASPVGPTQVKEAHCTCDGASRLIPWVLLHAAAFLAGPPWCQPFSKNCRR